MIEHEVIVIGGGAAGMTSAIIAKEYGKKVAIIEGGNRVGRKIITTGNGRCNITNRQIKHPYKTFHSNNAGFFVPVLDALSVDDTIDFLYRLGLPTIELNKGKMYPQSLQASSVVDLFRLNIEERDIPVYLDSKVVMIKKVKNDFIIHTDNSENLQFKAEKLIITTGGFSAPKTGSDGSMYKLMTELGHSIIKPLPSIVQLKLNYPRLKAISGVRFDAKVNVLIDAKNVRSDVEEVLFTDYGISGPAILQVSREASIGMDKRQDVEIELDIFYKKSLNDVIDFFEMHFSLFSHRSVADSLNGILNKKLIPILLKDAGITNIHKTCDLLEYDEKMSFYGLLKSWRFPCIDTNGFTNAQATIGGVDTKEVDQHSLESKVIPNLYIAGELLDVDGDCGGFNLQWAWSSGYVAAINASK